MMDLDQIVNKALSRRTFLAGAGAVAATTAIAGCSDNAASTAPTTSTYSDADILNYALNLEYLEAEFYLRAATGQGLASADYSIPSGYTGIYTVGSVTTTGNITVGAVPGLSPAQQAILNEIAYEEQQHVRFLRAALGSAAVPRPALDLTFFSTLANIALGTPVTGTGAFTPFDNFNDFLIGSFIFEDVGVTAYSGAAPLISAAGVASGYLTAAAGILAVEAYHAAYVRTALTGIGIATNSNTYIGIANKVEALRATLTVGASAAPGQTGSVETPLTLPTSSSTPSAIVAASAANATGFARTPSQVHHIVYGNATVGANKGGFFPNGTNSIFATTTS